ncbi:Putrescine transport system permease protein PotH [Oligella ureolytica]|uniref:ABC transporter permease subunit n=1 Tax=Oligella ureolytica TaxID=90244 RepID=A0A378XJZ5_9BURK|nr:ABC transporter permease subunit [Oligella ureolytica]QPT39878.1 ABC transporter permease subunit [Oligella ureolytica]SUA57861.1 Putrescine transport system permease protein PotH [Oligella ureolytica]
MTKLKKSFAWLPTRERLSILPPYAWLILTLLVPFLIVLKISFAESIFGQPPYSQLLEYKDGVLRIALYLESYITLFSDSLFVDAYLRSIRMAVVTTLFCVLIGYPMAYFIAQANPKTRNLLLLGVILPFWTSLLLRVYAWAGILRNEGLLNSFLLWTGLIDSPIELYRTDTAVYIGLVYTYLPFFILPLYTNLLKHDRRLLDAAYDLGARPFKAFLTITLPLSISGVIAGSMLVFIPAVGEYVIPELLGGTNTYMIGRVMWDQYFTNSNWPMAAAIAVVMLMILLIPLVLFQINQAKQYKEQD